MRHWVIVLLLAGFSPMQAIAQSETPDNPIQQASEAGQQPSEAGAVSAPALTPSMIAPPLPISGDPVKPKQTISGDALCERYGYGKDTEEFKLCIGYAEESGYSRDNEEGGRRKKRRKE